MSAQPSPPRVLVLSGGLIHLVHQLAVVRELPELERGAEAAPIAVLITGVLRRDGAGLARLEAVIGRWFAQLRRSDPRGFGGLRLVNDEAGLEPGAWDLACLNNQWQRAQRAPIERLGIRRLLVCGDGLGLYYRCARELRALAPSLLGQPIAEPGRSVSYVLSGRQPRWHQPPQAALPPPLERRSALFAALVASLREEAEPLVERCLAAAPADRPVWLCSVPNLAHQFPGGAMPAAVLERWGRALAGGRPGFDRSRDRLVLIEHPKAPPAGSFAGPAPTWLGESLRAPVPLEVLVCLVRERAPQRPVLVAGLTSALYGVRALSEAGVVWLPLAPLWWTNPRYWRQPLEFLHRLLRVHRMALLTSAPARASDPAGRESRR